MLRPGGGGYVSIADGGDGGDYEVERGHVLLVARGEIVAVARDPRLLVEVLESGEEEPEASEVVAENEERDAQG